MYNFLRCSNSMWHFTTEFDQTSQDDSLDNSRFWFRSTTVYSVLLPIYNTRTMDSATLIVIILTVKEFHGM